MTEHQEEQEGGLAVPGPESHESEETLSAEELGREDQPVPPPSTPKSSATQQSLWDRIMGKLRG